MLFPHPDKPCILDTDASDEAIGAVLSQVIDGTKRSIAFYSRIMSTTQRNYCPTRRELLAVIAALQHFCHYLIGSKITLRTDHHSLEWLNTLKRQEGGILVRWVETLAEFDFEIEHRPGQLHCNADGVSRHVCKQCIGRVPKTPWVDELERADELTEPLGVRGLTGAPEISHQEMVEMKNEDEIIQPIIQWMTDDYTPNRDELRSHPLAARNLWAQHAVLLFKDEVLVRQQGDTHQLVVPQAIRRTSHLLQLPDHTTHLSDKNFITHMLYKNA